MKKTIIIAVAILILAISGYFIAGTEITGYKNIDASVAEQMKHPIFTVTPEQESDEQNLAIYLYSQHLELAKQGKVITSEGYDNGKEQFKCDKIKDYKINKIHVFKNEDDASDTFKFWVTYDLLPKNKNSDWAAGNGGIGENGWILKKSAFVEFKKEHDTYKLISTSTGV